MHLRNPAPSVVLRPPKHREWIGIDSKAERACGSHARSTCQDQKPPGQGAAAERQRRGGPASPTSGVTRASAARLAPYIPPAAPAERRWFSSIVASTRHQMDWSSTPGEIRECSTSAKREHAPRVPMRLARGTSRPASIAAHQMVAPRVAVTAEHGCQHLSTDSRTEVATDCSAGVL